MPHHNDLSFKTGANDMNNFFARFANDESGVTAIEYALIAALMATVVIAAIGNVDTALKKTFTDIAAKLVVTG